MAGQGSPSCEDRETYVRKQAVDLTCSRTCTVICPYSATQLKTRLQPRLPTLEIYCTSRDSSQHVRHRETDYWLSPHQPLTVLSTAPSRRSAAKQCSHVPCVPVLHHFYLPVYGCHQPYGKSDVPSETRQHLELKVRQREALGALYTGRTTTRLNNTAEEVSRYTSEQARVLPTTAHACLLYTPIT